MMETTRRICRKQLFDCNLLGSVLVLVLTNCDCRKVVVNLKSSQKTKAKKEQQKQKPTTATTTDIMSNTTSANNGNANLFTAAFATVVYVYTVSSLVSWWFFLLPNDLLPTVVAQTKLYSMETASKASSFQEVVFYNIGSMFAFGFFHSLLARKTVKKWMNLPVSVERSLFCLQGAFFLHMIQHCWVEVEGWNVWDVSNYPRVANFLLTGYWFGAGYLLSATFALDHFHLFGLSQGFGFDINKALGLAAPKHQEGGLASRWHYEHVAHPIMTGMFITLWVAPVMTPGKLVCAMFLSTYILIAVIKFEERTIRDELGSEYDKYLAKTPRFIPNLLPRGGSSLHVNVATKSD